MIKLGTPKDLYKAIIENKDLYEHTPKDLKEKGAEWMKIWGGLYLRFGEQKLTTNLLLERWIKEDHEDLYNVLMHGYMDDNQVFHTTFIDGKQIGWYWFDRQVTEIKAQIRIDILKMREKKEDGDKTLWS